jgi:hypothetical protein
MPAKMHKYPRTQHLTGSRLQPGDEDLEQAPFAELQGKFLVIEEKCDGANAGVSFTDEGQLLLQSRGHFLSGGGLGEDQFSLFKAWGQVHQEALWQLLGPRYVLYGEWLFKKHTVFYDQLDHYFLEFDVLDTEDGQFFSAARRREFLRDCQFIHSVPVLYEGETPRRLKDLVAFIGPSRLQSANWRENLLAETELRGFNVERVNRQTDFAGLMEGLYLKTEEDGRVTQRLKYVRWDFLQAVFAAASHVNDYPMLPNKLREGVDIFAA